MKEFPKLFRILSCACLVPASWGILLYTIGAVQPFGTSQMALGRLGLYIAAQLLWLVPVACFFLSVNEYRRGYYARAYCYTILGLCVGAIGLVETIKAF